MSTGLGSTISNLLADGVGKKYAKNLVNENVIEAMNAMNAVQRGSTLVFNNDGTLGGIFTERDFVTKVIWLYAALTQLQFIVVFFLLDC